MTTDEAKIAEACAKDVINCIQSFIDVLRDEFPTAVRSKRPTVPNKSMLYSRVEEEGLVRRVESIMTAQGNKLGRLPDAHQNRKATGTLSSIKDDERYRLVHNVLLPLVRLLTQCYSILDKILPSQPKPTENTSRKKTKKPEPPVGMLSIQNYTDVACLLEFLVLTNILPYLDANVMISAQDRIQYHLPKSLAGRMPRAALAWNSMQASSISASEKSFELLTTSITISSLVMLDRFKPMLLPRHLSDLYAATFQTQQWEKVSDSQSASDIALLYRTLGLRPTSRLNPVLQAKAYQTMLLRGTKAPAWLRQTVSSLLSQLACTDLFSIIQVFCPTQEAAMASQRLGRALAGTPFKEALVQQMLGLMQGIFPTNGEISGPTVSILETVWAVLNEWSPDTIRSELIELWENGIMDTGTRDGQTIHATVRQIGALFSFVPNVSISLKVLHQIPKSIILPQLVRLGSMSSIFASNARDDAKQTLHWISQAICSVTQSTMIGSVAVSAEGLMAIAWVNSLEPNSWDLSGNEYYIQDLESQFSSIKGFECLGIRKCDASVLDLKRIIEHGTRRVDVLLETTYVVHEQEGFTRLKGLCCRIFHLILELYLSKSTKKTLSAISSMVPILSLPTLFERCSPEDLLFGDSSNATSLLFLIKISLISVDRSHKSTTINEGASTRSESPLAVENGLAEGLFEFRKVVTMHTASQTSSSLLSGLDDKEDFASSLQIAFIMLSLLVSVLEFGSTLRSLDEEEVLHSFSPVLESLAQLDENSSTVIPSYIEESRAEMADVAAYALSLIASRSAPRTREAGQLDSESPYDVLKSIIMQSENDLRSAEPPIRARGIVELGRLARGYLGIIAKENLSSGKSSLINILQDNESVSSNESTINFVVDEILRLSIGAVGDKESYVYLAAVQTIVSIGDMRPKKLIPLVASIVVTGRWQLGSAETDYQSINVTGEERIKLAEALIFMIKRRPVVEEYVPTLLALMTFGDERANHDSDKAEDSLFRSETHKYFITEAKQEAGEYEPSQKELWEEKDIRLKTGGPVFKAEELDVVRAARASVLAALVSKSPPRTIALDCAFLVRLINDTLVLETSRSVCRAIATLALALYESALRELEEVLAALETASAQMVTTRASIPFTVALISSDEEVLHSNLAAKSTGGLAVSQQTLNDPATSARCKEALILRQQAEETGLFSCARIALSQDLSNRDYPQMLRVLKANADMGVKVKLSIE